MQKFYLENMYLKVTINQKGAEVASILSKENGQQYLWNADEKFWKRSSPVLFPIVGSLVDGKYTVDGKEYPMSQHGFARDMDFKMIKQPDGKKITFKLDYSEETLKMYPYPFSLEIEYTLEKYKLSCKWRVTNLDKKPMYFQIGAHPAFNCPLKNGEKQSDYYISVDTDKDLTYSLLGEGGLIAKDGQTLKNDGGSVKIDEHMFDNDALIFDGQQATKVSLCKPDKMSYITVGFEAPLFGIWSPAGKNAPFVCIEPWYGRADREGFSGDISEREHINKLAGHSIFEAGYFIEINV